MNRLHFPDRRPLLIGACALAAVLLVGLFCLTIGLAETMNFLSLSAFGLAMTAEATLVRCRHDARKTAAAAIAGCEIQQMPDGRAGYLTQVSALVAGQHANFATTGQVTVPKTSGIVILDGGEVYWDHSANAAHFKPVNDRDFYLGTAVGDAASAATTMVVNLNVRPVYAIDISRDPFDTTIVLTAGTPALTTRGSSLHMTFSATAEAQKVDALSKAGFAVGANAIVKGVVEIVDDGDAAAIDFNVGVASATAADDADGIAESVFIHTDGNVVNILAESDDGSTEVNATDTTVDYVLATPFEFWMDFRDPADVQIYVDGVLVLSGSTFDVSAATGPLKLLAHLEKSSDNTTADYRVHELKARLQE